MKRSAGWMLLFESSVVPRTLAFLISSAVLVGCASAPAARVSATEAFGVAQTTKRARAAAAVKKTPQRDGAEMSAELDSALVRFAHAARLERARLEPGAAMPAGAVKNWLMLNGAIDSLLQRSASRTSSFDVIRARITAEAELELEARAYGDIPPELAEGVLKRIGLLATRMAEVRRLHVETQRKRTMFSWPVDPPVVTSLFGRRLHPIAGTWKQHFGIDLAADEGQLVSAAAEGVVLKAGMNGAHGLQVELQHSGGVVTRYSHLSEALVEPGLVLKKGDPIGLAGSTGATTGAHLHFEIWRLGEPLDPLEELGRPLPETDSVASL